MRETATAIRFEEIATLPIIQDLPRPKLLREFYLEEAKASLQSSLEREEAGPALSSKARSEYFRSREFTQWVSNERALGKTVLWLTDLDKAMGAGDIFTFFFDWRLDNGGFSAEQGEALSSFLKNTGKLSDVEERLIESGSPNDAARMVLTLWRRGLEDSATGISLGEFWTEAYWASQAGLSGEEKKSLASEFAPTYKDKIFPGVTEANSALKEAGVRIVMVTNGDEELAKSVAPLLGIEEADVVGTGHIYEEGRSTGQMHTLEIFEGEWSNRPQPGKALNFRCWLTHRSELNGEDVTVAGFDGDSFGADGGAMLFLQPNPVLGYFMVDTPGSRDAGRIEKFREGVLKYGGWQKEKFIRLSYEKPVGCSLPQW